LFSKKEKIPADYLKVDIYTYQKLSETEIQKTLKGQGSGSWLEFLQIDEEVYWKINDVVDEWSTDVKNLLPSHSQLRKDANLIKSKDWVKAQLEKEKGEHLQRDDEKLRHDHKKHTK